MLWLLTYTSALQKQVRYRRSPQQTWGRQHLFSAFLLIWLNLIKYHLNRSKSEWRRIRWGCLWHVNPNSTYCSCEDWIRRFFLFGLFCFKSCTFMWPFLISMNERLHRSSMRMWNYREAWNICLVISIGGAWLHLWWHLYLLIGEVVEVLPNALLAAIWWVHSCKCRALQLFLSHRTCVCSIVLCVCMSVVLWCLLCFCVWLCLS